MQFRTASDLVNVTALVRTASGLVQLAPAIRTASGLVEVGASAAALAVVLSSLEASGATDEVDRRVTTSSITATASGGVPPYTFGWGGMTDFTALAPSAATTAFRTVNTLGSGETALDSATITVSDSASTPATVNATVSLYAQNYG